MNLGDLPVKRIIIGPNKLLKKETAFTLRFQRLLIQPNQVNSKLKRSVKKFELPQNSSDPKKPKIKFQNMSFI